MPEQSSPFPPNHIPGLTPDQANRVVELANQMNNIDTVTKLLEPSQPQLAETARTKFVEKGEQVGDILRIGQTALAAEGSRPDSELVSAARQD